MGGDRIPLVKSLKLETEKDRISILVVDDDSISLSIVAAIMRKYKYEVEAVNHPIKALNTLRDKPGKFDLVVSDVNMPDMNGIQLLKVITEEFNLPVGLMSTDDDESTVQKGLENGALFFLSKPISQEKIRDLWKFVAVKSEQQVVIDDSRPDDDAATGDI